MHPFRGLAGRVRSRGKVAAADPRRDLAFLRQERGALDVHRFTDVSLNLGTKSRASTAQSRVPSITYEHFEAKRHPCVARAATQSLASFEPQPKMRIAQVAPLYESVPPLGYGGTERVVSYLTEALVELGHDVTLFASGDSVTAAKLVPICPRSLRLDKGCLDKLAHHIVELERVFERAHEFDIIHFHIDYLHFPFSRRLNVPHLTTLHGRLDLPDLSPLYRVFADMPLISISDAQRKPIRNANWVATVHHGLPEDLYTADYQPSDYFAFLGRISAEKRADRAIEIAKRVGIPLKIAAKVDPADVEYFHSEIEPLLDDALVDFVGEIGERDKVSFLNRALAMLFPIDWPEPFGLVMIEAMACGTPVIAYGRGSVPEVIEDGVTGFVVADLEEAVEAARRVVELDRRRVRREFERRFSAPRMARDYLAVYEMLARKPARAAVLVAGAEPGNGHARARV
jgi:glycosyltransferase involved in cell wall biosynthesis